MHAILAARSNFSLGESILTVERLIDQAKNVGAKAVALTDTMSVTALIDFTVKCKAKDIKPIIGCRLRFVDDVTRRKEKGVKWKKSAQFFLTWYVLSEKGLLALYRLLTLANSESHFYFHPQLCLDDLYAELATLTADDVAIASSDAHSVFHRKDASDVLSRVASFLDARSVYCSLTPIDTPLFDTLNKRAIETARALNLPMLVTYPLCYGKGESDQATIMGSIIEKAKISDPWANFPAHDDAYPITEKDLVARCTGAIKRLIARGVPDPKVAFLTAIQNQDVLVGRVTYEWVKQPPSLPVMAKDEFGVVTRLCVEGWKKRFVAPIFGHKPSDKELAEIYRPRLKFELEVLRKLDFSGYFLLVHDIVQFAKTSGILVGPGRGSVGGSLVAYLMGITECDPLRFGLLFERFINPDRIDLPDADLDFMAARRHEIFAYLIEKYGTNRVAGVSNFGTLGPASSIRDVSRASGLQDHEYRCSTLTLSSHGVNLPLEDCAKGVSDIGAFRDKHPFIWKTCLTLEGVLRNLSQHAAGVVVGGCDLVERAVVERRSGSSVVCWDKRIVEDQGLIKVDILGLQTLDLIYLALQYIKEQHGVDLDLMSIPLDNPDVLDNFAKANTDGIFQFESGGMKRLLKELGADGTITFDDITAATALYRPGPMDSGMMDSYWKRKQGIEAIDIDHPAMKDIVAPTYGVFPYQEQVMQTAVAVAGYTLPEADKLRKIMGKKLPAEMKKQKEKFVSGCIAAHYEIEVVGGAKFKLIADREYKTEDAGYQSVDAIFASDYSICIPLDYRLL